MRKGGQSGRPFSVLSLAHFLSGHPLQSGIVPFGQVLVLGQVLVPWKGEELDEIVVCRNLCEKLAR